MNYKVLIYIGLVSFTLTLISACNANVDVQKNARDITRENVRLDTQKPTAYLEFVKLDKRVDSEPYVPGRSSEDLEPAPEEFEAVLLRIHNNSRWAMKFQMKSNSPDVETISLPDKGQVQVPSANAELELVYGVELVNPEAPSQISLKRAIPYVRLYRSVGDVWLPSGQSVVFIVRREELKRNLQVFLPFKFEWEISGQNKGYAEPQHRVYFARNEFEKAAGL
jgi:hypothetical protein